VTVATDQRWPHFLAAAEGLGIRSTLSVPLVGGEEAVGALNLYSKSTAEYSDEARKTASLFADQLSVAAANATVLANAVILNRQLQEAMLPRAVIEQAKGILMSAQHCSEDRAFDILRRASQGQNRKLRDIAADVVGDYTDGDPSTPQT